MELIFPANAVFCDLLRNITLFHARLDLYLRYFEEEVVFERRSRQQHFASTIYRTLGLFRARNVQPK